MFLLGLRAIALTPPHRAPVRDIPQETFRCTENTSLSVLLHHSGLVQPQWSPVTSLPKRLAGFLQRAPGFTKNIVCWSMALSSVDQTSWKPVAGYPLRKRASVTRRLKIHSRPSLQTSMLKNKALAKQDGKTSPTSGIHGNGVVILPAGE